MGKPKIPFFLLFFTDDYARMGSVFACLGLNPMNDLRNQVVAEQDVNVEDHKSCLTHFEKWKDQISCLVCICLSLLFFTDDDCKNGFSVCQSGVQPMQRMMRQKKPQRYFCLDR